MSGFVLSPAARTDLDEIWEYTAERWSTDQAERYIRAIVDACQALADGRRKGVAIDHIRKGYFKQHRPLYLFSLPTRPIRKNPAIGSNQHTRVHRIKPRSSGEHR